MRELLFDVLDLADITFFGQDWGSLIGLRLVGEHPERFARGRDRQRRPAHRRPADERRVPAVAAVRQRVAPSSRSGRSSTAARATDLPAEVIAAYDAPFPDDTYKAGARVFPSLVPTTPDDPAAAANRAAWETLRRFHRPFLCTFSDRDPITAGGDRRVPARGARRLRPAPRHDRGGGHFLQEDRGPELARVLADFVARTG